MNYELSLKALQEIGEQYCVPGFHDTSVIKDAETDHRGGNTNLTDTDTNFQNKAISINLQNLTATQVFISMYYSFVNLFLQSMKGTGGS